MSNRRKFIQHSITAIGATLASTSLAKAASLLPENKSIIELKHDDIILFQGDSITDHGRDRQITSPNNPQAMGNGYAMLATGKILNTYAGKNIKIYNRGISGNKVPQLEERWQSDCLDLKPTILSILIGINDYWHKKNGNYKGSVKTYKENYKKLLDTTLSKLPNVKLIIGEPFAVKDVKYVDNTWYPEFSSYQSVALDLASEYDAVFIPYQEVFDQAQNRANGAYWTTDGVHTTMAGANLMAEAWLKTIK